MVLPLLTALAALPSFHTSLRGPDFQPSAPPYVPCVPRVATLTPLLLFLFYLFYIIDHNDRSPHHVTLLSDHTAVMRTTSSSDVDFLQQKLLKAEKQNKNKHHMETLGVENGTFWGQIKMNTTDRTWG